MRDTGTPTLSTVYRNITVDIINLPDNAPFFNQTLYHHATNPTAYAGKVLFRVQAADADIGSSNDSLQYVISSIQITGDNGVNPRIVMREDTGEIVSEVAQVLNPGAEITVIIRAYDQSAFDLSSTTTLIITVVHNSLAFTVEEYSLTVSEDVPLGSSVATLDLDPLSVSSEVMFTFSVIDPVLFPSLIPFTLISNRTSTIIALRSHGVGLNREHIDHYVIEVTASQQNETAQTTVTIDVADANDNSPRLLDTDGTVIFITENTQINTVVTRINATDLDTGENARLNFEILGHDLNLPFNVNNTTGIIRTRNVLTGEDILPSYDVTVYVRDFGQPRLETYITYTFNITRFENQSETVTSLISPTVSPTANPTAPQTTKPSMTFTELPTTGLTSFIFVIIGVCVFFLLVVLIVVITIAVFVWWKNRRNRQKKEIKYKSDSINNNTKS